MTFSRVANSYARMWDDAHVVEQALDLHVLSRIVNLRSVFESAAQACGAPWWWIAAILYREADLDTMCYLGNGEKLDKKTKLVPKGRGPFKSFAEGCRDALFIQKVDGMSLSLYAPNTWTIEFALYAAEELNGTGYISHNENSPYIWAGTNLEQSGLFTSDHGYDRNVRDKRLGVAAIAKALEAAKLIILSRTQKDTIMAESIAPTQIVQPVLSIPNGPNILLDVEKGLGQLLDIEPFIAAFYPPAAIASPFIPAAKELLNGLEEAAAASDPIAEFGTHLHTILDDVLQGLGKKQL